MFSRYRPGIDEGAYPCPSCAAAAISTCQLLRTASTATTRLRPPSFAAYMARSALTKKLAMSSSWVGARLATPMLALSHGPLGERGCGSCSASMLERIYSASAAALVAAVSANSSTNSSPP